MKKEVSFLKKAMNKYCWGFIYDSYTSLYFEIGTPHTHILWEPHESKVKSLRLRRAFARRFLVNRGDMMCQISHAYWAIISGGKTIASSSSGKRIMREALADLNGQKLTGVCIDNETGRTSFCFDLGAQLIVRRWEKNSHEELWHLNSTGKYLCVYGDGKIKWKKGTDPAV